jgi:hypothetical protein
LYASLFFSTLHPSHPPWVYLPNNIWTEQGGLEVNL